MIVVTSIVRGFFLLISEVDGTTDHRQGIIALLFVIDITLIIVKQPSLKITLNLMHAWTQGDYFTKHIKTSNWVIR